MLRNTLRKADISLILVATVGLGLSIIAFFYVHQWEYDQAFQEKQKQADDYVRTLRQTFSTFSNVLHSIRGLHNVDNRITRESFTQFVDKELLNYHGIQGLAWIAQVPATQRLVVEQYIQQREHIPTFQFWEQSLYGNNKQPAIFRQYHYPILFIEPMQDNVQHRGYDVSSDPILQTALERARDQGQLIASGAIQYISDRRNTANGFYVFLPVYQKGIPSTEEKRRQSLVGFASGIVLYQDLIQAVLRLPKQRTDVFLTIIDNTQGSQGRVLYAPNWYLHDPDLQGQSKQILETPLEFGGRQWLIVLNHMEDGFKSQTNYAWGVLAVVVLFTLGVLHYMYVTLTRARWAEDLVAKRTLSLSEANQALNREVEVRQRMTIDLKISQQRFQAIFDEAAMGIVQTDLRGRILQSNKAMQFLLGYEEHELENRYLKEFAYSEDKEADISLLQKMLEGKFNTYLIGKRYIHKDKHIIWTSQNCSIVRDVISPFLISMVEDITERKQAEEARLQAEKKYRKIFENAIEGIFQCTPEGRFLNVNPAFVRMLGYESAEQLCQEVTDIGTQVYAHPEQRQKFLELLETQSEVQGFEYQARCRDGTVIWVNETVRLVKDQEQGISFYEGIVEDVTERKCTEEKLLYDASHDQLTGLFNRHAFTERLSEALEQLHKKREEIGDLPLVESNSIQFAVLFVDLDRFKIVNDSMGHWWGDKLLVQIARRLHALCEDDIAARFGGDEFAVLLTGIPNSSELEERVQQIQGRLQQPYILEGQTLITTVSTGVAVAYMNSHLYSSTDEILRDADTAMYEAKRAGKSRYVIFQPGMHAYVASMLQMEADIRNAFEKGEFVLYYQPIVSLQKRHLIGVEALIRWKHPERGMIMPDKFIPLSEETGLINYLGLWVFETACMQLKKWQTQFPAYENLSMNINVSPIQLRQTRIVNDIQDILEQTGIEPSTCHMEITESAMMQDPEAMLTVLNDIKQLGVQQYVDDFGTGYSSLSYLRRFPIDALKIDKSFIQEIDAPGKSTHVAKAIISLGDAFNLKVVAEGVDSSFQIAVLESAHCHYLQGYLFSRPKDAQSMEEYLALGLQDEVAIAIDGEVRMQKSCA